MSPFDLRHPPVRFLAAFCRYLPGPILFEPDGPSSAPLTRISVPQARLFAIAVGNLPAPTIEQVDLMVANTQQDAILLRLCQDVSNPFRFDIILAGANRTEGFADYRLYVDEEAQATLIPPRFGDAVFIGNSGLIPTGQMPFNGPVERLQGLGRATAEMAMFVGGPLCATDIASGW